MELPYKDICPGKGRAYNADCFEVMKEMPDGCVDMILCDLPYGTTACKWDVVIPFKPLWAEFHRVAKPNAAIVLTAAQPFTTTLIASNLGNFRYSWVWEKTMATGGLHANFRPMKAHEDICVFYKKSGIFNKQRLEGEPYTRKEGSKKNSIIGDKAGGYVTENLQGGRNPRSVLKIANPNGKTFHPTQKPVALFEYLINTYTNPGDLIFDPTAGSLTTGVAAQNLGRRWVCVEQDAGYFAKGCERFSK